MRPARVRSYGRDMTSDQARSLEPAPLDISVGPGAVVAITGEIDVESGATLRDQLLRVIRRQGAHLALDLSGVTFMDCAGINVLLAVRRRAELEDGSLRVLRASPWVRRVIALTNLERVLMPAAPSHAAAS
jgi:anti-anti-sigma factor